MAAPAPPAQAAHPPQDLTKPVANVDDVKARISSKQPGQPWHQPLFNPFQDPVRCLLGYCCGACIYGMTAAKVDGTPDEWIVPALIYYISSAFCLQWYVGQPTRSKIRQKYGLEEAPYSDCISHTGLCCFAICQESAEIDFQEKKGAGGADKPTAAPAPPPATAAPPAQQI